MSKVPEFIGQEETLRLLNRFKQDGDMEARSQVIEGNLRLVYKIAAGFGFKNREAHDDLIQEGSRALMEAVDRFDPNMGRAFSTYAFRYVRGYMLNLLNNPFNRTLYLQNQRFGGDGATYEEFVQDETMTPEEKFTLDDSQQSVDAVIDRFCTPVEAIAFRRRFGLWNGVESTLAEVGEELNMTPQGARAAQNRAIEKLQAAVPQIIEVLSIREKAS